MVSFDSFLKFLTIFDNVGTKVSRAALADFCTSKTWVARDEMSADGSHTNDSPEQKEIQDTKPTKK